MTQGYEAFICQFKIAHHRIFITPNKEPKDGKDKKRTSLDSICAALLVVMDSANHPIHIHCNQGKHRTGCVVACMRKMQGFSTAEAIAEYTTYAAPKTRPGDIELIESFEPETFYQYAQKIGFISRMDVQFAKFGLEPVKCIDGFVAALSMRAQLRDLDLLPLLSNSPPSSSTSSLVTVNGSQSSATSSSAPIATSAPLVTPIFSTPPVGATLHTPIASTPLSGSLSDSSPDTTLTPIDPALLTRSASNPAPLVTLSAATNITAALDQVNLTGSDDDASNDDLGMSETLELHGVNDKNTAYDSDAAASAALL